METTYSKKNEPNKKMVDSTASTILDNSSQSESLQRKADLVNNTAQRAAPPRPNNTGMPDNLKSGIESLSGFSMDDVRVHYNSSKPATVQALAYTQGTDIHVAPGQEKHLPHEAWHVAQQMAGRVSPTTIINGMPVNDNAALEHEADVMGEKATTQKTTDALNLKKTYPCKRNIQRMPVSKCLTCFKKNHLLNHNGLSYLEGFTPEQVALNRFTNSSIWQNSMIERANFEKMPDASPNEDRIVDARTWHIISNGSTATVKGGDVPVKVHLKFNEKGLAWHIDDRIGIGRMK